jgi:4-hydroxy 2-oxovalerate aldolase
LKIIDVTLRDGGFVNDFNWDLKQAKSHVNAMADIGVHIIELGYWKQTEKSSNPFYNMDENTLVFLTDNLDSTIVVAVMIDFSYCSKNIEDYPKLGDTKLQLIRVTSRKEDFPEALKFAMKLKAETGLKISFQVINVTNYSEIELIDLAEKISKTDLDIVAFADSHGNLNLQSNLSIYRPAIDILEKSNKEWGFHLHNHTGRANMNYWMLQNESCNYIDGSVNGLGKGGGNLRLEEIVINEKLPKMLDYMMTTSSDEMKISKPRAYNILCGRANVTDNYRKMGIKHNVDLYLFQSILSRLEGSIKDSYSESDFEFLLEKI